MTHDMRHMNYISAVAANDVSMLREKEATYQGSWKRAGGRSAWFMLRRNMDRILTMMKPPANDVQFSILDFDDALVESEKEDKDFLCNPAVARYLRDCYLSEDIFAKIEERPDGGDGTILACVRDLRCYLTLVEAEMMARGDVPATHAVNKGGGVSITTTLGVYDDDHRIEICGLTENQTKELARYANEMVDRARAPVKKVHADCEKVKDYVDGRFYAHEDPPKSELPWEIDAVRYGAVTGGPSVYTRRGETYRLDPYVTLETPIPQNVSHLYFGEGGDYLYLNYAAMPEEIRALYEKIPFELNNREHELMTAAWRDLYEWSNEKWRLKPKFAAWGRSA